MTLWLPTLVALVAWVPALLGLGRLLRVSLPVAAETGFTGLLGLAVLAAAALWAGLFLPVNSAVALPIWLAGLAALAWNWRWALSRLRADGLVLFVLAVWVALRLPVSTYDDGLYYLQAVEWIRASAPVPGLANLHNRFGFNSAWFVVAAALELPGMRGASRLFALGVPVVLGGTAAVAALRAVWRGDRSFGAMLAALLGVPVALMIGMIGSLSADAMVLILGASSLALVGFSLDEAGNEDAARGALLLASLAFASKISTAVLLAGALAAWGVGVLRAPSRRGVAVALGLGGPALLLAPWLVRGFLTSGCWLHPVAFTCYAGVPWSVSPEEVQRQADWIRSWARLPKVAPEVVLADYGWIGPWAEHAAGDPIVRFLGGLLGSGLAAMALLRRPPGRAAWFLAAVVVAGSVFWWLSAPDPRFGLAYLVPLATLPLAVALALPAGAPPGPPRAFRAVAAAVGLLALGTAVTLPGTPEVAERPTFPLVVTQWPGTIPAPLRVETSARGYRSYVPDKGDQCWAAPLPCTPELRPDLRAVDGTLRIR